MYTGQLYLPSAGSVFELTQDYVGIIGIRGVSSYSKKIHEVIKYGVELVKPNPNDPDFVENAIFKIPAGNKFVIHIKRNRYELSFTQKLNPDGVYNIVLTNPTTTFEVKQIS